MDEEPIVNDSDDELEPDANTSQYTRVDKIFKVYLGAPPVPINIYCTQGDTLWRWRFQFYDDNGRWVIPHGTSDTVVFSGVRPDKARTPFSVTGSCVQVGTDWEIMIAPTNQVTCEAGVAKAVLQIVDSNQPTTADSFIIASQPINLHIASNPNSNRTNTTVSTDAWNQVLQQISNVAAGSGQPLSANLHESNCAAKASTVGDEIAEIRKRLNGLNERFYDNSTTTEAIQVFSAPPLGENNKTSPQTGLLTEDSIIRISPYLLFHYSLNTNNGRVFLSTNEEAASKVTTSCCINNLRDLKRIYVDNSGSGNYSYKLRVFANDYGPGKEAILISARSGNNFTTDYSFDTDRRYKYIWIVVNKFSGSTIVAIDNISEVTNKIFIERYTNSYDIENRMPGYEYLPEKYDFTDKKVVFFGDSITAGVRSYIYTSGSSTIRGSSAFTQGSTPGPDGVVFVESDTWRDIFLTKVGAQKTSDRKQAESSSVFLKDLIGAGGTTLPSISDKVNTYCQSNPTVPPDYIFVAGGVNDCQFGSPLGSFTDGYSNPATSFYAAVKYCCDKLQTTFPNAKVIFITPINSTFFERYLYGKTAITYYRRAIYEVATSYGFSVIDGASFGFPLTENAYADKMIADGLHPTKEGHKFYADTLYGRLKISQDDELKSAITQVESDIYTVSDNLFDFDNIVSNKTPASVGSGANDFVSLNGWNTSNYIPVTAGDQYALILNGNITTGAVFRVACYANGTETYKSSGQESNPYTIPDGVDHIRFFSNTASLFATRTATSFKKYSSDMSKAWTPYGNQENFLVKGALPEYGVYVDGTNYYHFVNFGEKTLIRLFKQEGPNNLFQYSATYVGEVSKYGVSINETIATNGTDTVGPISIMRQGVDSGGMWSGGWHTRTVNNVACPTAKQDSLDIKVNGESIIGLNGLHYGECVATVVNKLYFPQTITGTDLSTATQAIQETVTYILNEKMTARVAHKYVADTRVILYYGMQAVRIGFNNILLPNNETAFAFADMTANINLDKPEDLMQMSNNDWNYDLIVKPFGLAKYTHNSGAGATKYGYLPTATRKVYWALMEGTYDYTFITSGKVLVWEGVWDIYPN